MQKRGGNVSLNKYDDIFSTEQSRAEDRLEKVREIPLAELHPFKNHPFKVLDDESMQRTVESIARFGVLSPAIARPSPDGGYELVAGHRRHHACELVGMETMPVIVRELDDDAATILMVDSNLQRETILPSERAFAYKMKLEAIKHQGMRSDLTSTQVAQKLSVQQVGDEAGVSKDTVRRFIRLTELIPELLEMVDQKQIAFNPAVELSFLKPEEQKQLLEAMDYAQATPSLSQAQRLKKYSQEGKCTFEVMCTVMDEEKKTDIDRVIIKQDVLRKYFPKSYTPKQMEDTIIRLLEQWQRKNRENRNGKRKRYAPQRVFFYAQRKGEIQMDIRVNISGNVNFFVPVLSGSTDEARRLLSYYEKELEGNKTEEAAALLDFLRDFLEECQEEQDKGKSKGKEEAGEQMDENVNVMIVEPGKPAKLMKLPLALELMEQDFQGTAEAMECVVPTYDLTMRCSSGKVIPVGDEKFLFGKAMICKKVCDDFYLPLTRDEIHDVTRIFEMLTVTLCADGKDFQAFRI